MAGCPCSVLGLPLLCAAVPLLRRCCLVPHLSLYMSPHVSACVIAGLVCRCCCWSCPLSPLVSLHVSSPICLWGRRSGLPLPLLPCLPTSPYMSPQLSACVIAVLVCRSSSAADLSPHLSPTCLPAYSPESCRGSFFCFGLPLPFLPCLPACLPPVGCLCDCLLLSLCLLTFLPACLSVSVLVSAVVCLHDRRFVCRCLLTSLPPCLPVCLAFRLLLLLLLPSCLLSPTCLPACFV